MRAFQRDPIAVAVTTALILVAAVAGPVQAKPPSPGSPPSALTASPTSSPIPLAPRGSVTVTVTNLDRRASTSALSVTLATNPSSAPFAIVGGTCAGAILRPGESCTVVVIYSGSLPPIDHTAALTVASGKPLKASVTRVIEVGVTFGDVCGAQGGVAGSGGTITVLGHPSAVGDRCDWDSILATTPYNAAFEALAEECRDLGQATVGYPVTGETGRTAIGCVAG